MTKQSIESLIGDPANAKGRPLVNRVTAATKKAIERDMAKIVAAEKKGTAIPTLARIAAYVLENYGLRADRSRVGEWLHRLRNKKPMW